MEPVALLNAVLRVIHIFSAALWIGMNFTNTIFIVPAQRFAGPAGTALTNALYSRTSMTRVFPAVSITATLAGLLLYATGSSAHFSNIGNAVLGIGALAGLAAAGHGVGLGALADRYAAAVAAVSTDAKAENVTLMEQLNARLYRSAWVSLGLSMVALLFMASARYL